MYKIVVFAPKSDVDPLITAMGDAGAGTIGNYSHCAFVTQGVGHWKSLPGSHPTSGQVGKISIEKQYKIEIVCPKELLTKVVSAIHNTHSYETPEINVVELVDVED